MTAVNTILTLNNGFNNIPHSDSPALREMIEERLRSKDGVYPGAFWNLGGEEGGIGCENSVLRACGDMKREREREKGQSVTV